MRTNLHSVDPSMQVARQGGYLVRLLGSMSEKGRMRFREMSRNRVVPPKTILADEGEESAELGFVLGGTLAVSKPLSDGRSHIIGLLVPADMYGRVFDGPHRHRVEALSDARLLSIRRADFQALLAREPEAERLLLAQALEELDSAREWALVRSGTKVVNRVAAFLVMLAGHGRNGASTGSAPLEVRLHLSRADLASYLGTRPETLSRAVHELAVRRIILIVDPYRFLIDDLPALVGLAGQNLGMLEEAGR